MFKWYEEAAICYAYLQDVPPEREVGQIWDSKKLEAARNEAWCRKEWCTKRRTLPELGAATVEVVDQTERYIKAWTLQGLKQEMVEAFHERGWLWTKGRILQALGPATTEAFRKSEWFARGWTLQELLAPEAVVFFNAEWEAIGTKYTLRAEIEEITGITNMKYFKSACVAQKMSWASKRKTTREEDMAYCLMGLFGVNMPPLYGEGKNAFLRLQLEILKVSDDESIFAWTWAPEPIFKTGRFVTGILAESPASFKFSGDVHRIPFDEERPLYSMTNKGLEIELFLQPAKVAESPPWFGSSDDFRGILFDEVKQRPCDRVQWRFLPTKIWPERQRVPPPTSEMFFAPLNCSRQRNGNPFMLVLVRQSGNCFARALNFPRTHFVSASQILPERKRLYISRTGFLSYDLLPDLWYRITSTE